MPLFRNCCEIRVARRCNNGTLISQQPLGQETYAVTGDAISGAEDMPGDLPKEADEVVEDIIQPTIEPDQKITEKPWPSIGDLEAMMAGKVRSLSKPRSG